MIFDVLLKQYILIAFRSYFSIISISTSKSFIQSINSLFWYLVTTLDEMRTPLAAHPYSCDVYWRPDCTSFEGNILELFAGQFNVLAQLLSIILGCNYAHSWPLNYSKLLRRPGSESDQKKSNPTRLLNNTSLTFASANNSVQRLFCLKYLNGGLSLSLCTYIFTSLAKIMSISRMILCIKLFATILS